ncbi:hypothetical protein SAY86_009720 [Trapa natans]|uniref:Extra-large guanine nucleotide-binding protein 1 n=1 Tax=Trapa natans TaxID=22666 RepID=A0AAN7QT90_TRANT|nr:hypothetical protein SAY86_009720 [Trapa natans]
MAAVMRRFVSLPPTAVAEDDEFPVEYSFALEYTGPPLYSDIPRAVPVDVGEIPTASALSSNPWLLDLSLPVIAPIKRKGFGCEKPDKQAKHGSSREADAASLSTIADENCAMPHSLDLPLSLGDSGRGDVGLVFEEDRINPEIVEIESPPPSSSSNYFSEKEEVSDYGSPHHARNSSIVTFHEPESSDVIDDEESVLTEPDDLIPVKPVAQKNKKKGSCYRCLRGNRFTRKETCIVCDSKFCRSCVLRAMGSMPEGRKCITCIGFRIDESKRGSLGRCSNMLKGLLSEEEVKRIMGSEKSCTTNQLPPNIVYVNNEALTQAELGLLQSCPNPPKNLRPGNYWYDRLSGYWGKEGQKPCQIITAELNIGGQIQRNASNGNTNILINKREITREEVWMLKVAGIQCEGEPHFWVSGDGSYMEEGQNNVKGRLWEKRKTKVFCAMLSLPLPPSITSSGREEGAQNNLDQNALHKLLLVGPDKSGTGTIFKQTKFLLGVPFTEDERQNIKLLIQSNLYSYLGILLEGREWFAEESLREENLKAKGKGLLVEESSSSGQMYQKEDGSTYAMGRKLKAFSDWLLKVIESGNLEVIVLSATREYALFVEELWKDRAIQATYNRRSELGLPRVATYFLERAIEISKEDYVPSDMDILYAEGITTSNGLACTEFSFPKPVEGEEYIDLYDQNDDSGRYQLIRVHPRCLGKNCKYLEMFEDVNMIVFCVSLVEYDEVSVDENGVSMNKMLASRNLLESIATHPAFYKKNFLLVLNKFDLLEQKIEQSPLTRCEWFHDFNPVISHNHKSGTYVNGSPSMAERAFHYIAVKFKRYFYSLTGQKLFVSMVTGLEQDSVQESLRYAKEVMNWHANEATVTQEESSTSMEASTTS